VCEQGRAEKGVTGSECVSRGGQDEPHGFRVRSATVQISEVTTDERNAG
jgi:hypothetical protein